MVMDNFNAIAQCANDVDEDAVKQDGSPVAGEITIFSADKTIKSGNLTGDVTTTGGTAKIDYPPPRPYGSW